VSVCNERRNNCTISELSVAVMSVPYFLKNIPTRSTSYTYCYMIRDLDLMHIFVIHFDALSHCGSRISHIQERATWNHLESLGVTWRAERVAQIGLWARTYIRSLDLQESALSPRLLVSCNYPAMSTCGNLLEQCGICAFLQPSRCKTPLVDVSCYCFATLSDSNCGT